MLKKFLFPVLLFITMPILGQDSIEQKKGRLSGNWRSFYLQTNNKKDLKDWKAVATGGFLKYEHSLFEGLKIGGAVYTSINPGLQDLQKPDALTGKLSRYEEGLFDRLHLNRSFLFLPGELYVQYSTQEHRFTAGRMKFGSPLVNGQDGRMIPSLFQGFEYGYNIPGTRLQAAIFNAVAPRSTGEFFQVGESIGTYPVGRNNTGASARYNTHTRSNYLLVAGIQQDISTNISFELWNYFTENISNSLYIKPTVKFNDELELQAEYLRQDRVNNGGNAIDSLSYFQDKNSDLFGLKVAYHWENKQSFSLSYNRILAGGKFIFPREWGREFLFSFQKRERSEGSANNHALVAYYQRDLQLNRLAIHGILSAGHHWKAAVQDGESNKYAMPDYTHLNLDFILSPEEFKQLSLELLVVYKIASGDFPENPAFYYNKTDMVQLNFIVNYSF